MSRMGPESYPQFGKILERLDMMKPMTGSKKLDYLYQKLDRLIESKALTEEVDELMSEINLLKDRLEKRKHFGKKADIIFSDVPKPIQRHKVIGKLFQRLAFRGYLVSSKEAKKISKRLIKMGFDLGRPETWLETFTQIKKIPLHLPTARKQLSSTTRRTSSHINVDSKDIQELISILRTLQSSSKEARGIRRRLRKLNYYLSGKSSK